MGGIANLIGGHPPERGRWDRPIGHLGAAPRPGELVDLAQLAYLGPPAVGVGGDLRVEQRRLQEIQLAAGDDARVGLGDQRGVVAQVGEVIGLGGEPFACLQRPELSVGGRLDEPRQLGVPPPRGDRARVTAQRRRANIDHGVGEGPRRRLAGGEITRQQRAAEVGLRRRPEPLGDPDPSGLAGGVQPEHGLQRRRDQIGEGATDPHLGQRCQVAAHRGDDVRVERHRRGGSGQRHAVEPGFVLEVGEAGGQRGLDLGGIAGGIDADALTGQRPGGVRRAGIEGPGVDDVGG